MPGKVSGKKVAAAPTATKHAAKKEEPKKNPLFERRPRTFGIGGNIQPKRDLTRFVRWPKYILLQRQRRVLLNRMKVPPPLNQFNKTLDKNSATSLFKLLNAYRPETKVQKKERLLAAAKAQAEKKDEAKPSKPTVVKYGLNHITRLVESKKAKLVVIAHDVDPIELVVWLPALCRKMDVPYCIVKSKARLGAVVHKKTATALAFTGVSKDDAPKLAELVTIAKDGFNKNVDARRSWGGGRLGPKAAAVVRKKQKAIAREAASKNKA